MSHAFRLDILPQPDDSTCGPTCLHAVYRYYGDHVELSRVIDAIPQLEAGGTLAVLLGCHALRRGYRAVIYTYNLDVFDPTWFAPWHEPAEFRPEHRRRLVDRLRDQMVFKRRPKLRAASRAYVEFLQLGGVLCMRDLNGELIRRYLSRSIPVLTGLCATYLYRAPREYGPELKADDIRGNPVGHFVVLCGYDPVRQEVSVADPYLPNPLGEEHFYDVGLDRLVCAMLLGVLTYDANLLIIEPDVVCPT